MNDNKVEGQNILYRRHRARDSEPEVKGSNVGH